MDDVLSEIIEERDRLEQIIIFLEKRLEKYMSLHEKIKYFSDTAKVDKVQAYDEIIAVLKSME